MAQIYSSAASSTTLNTPSSSSPKLPSQTELPTRSSPRAEHSQDSKKPATSPARPMDLLEQPLEAVAFRLYSLPEAAAPGAAAWTCLAAVLAAAAAAGIWRLRAAAPVVAMGGTSSGRNGLEAETSSATAAVASEQARSLERQPEPASSPSPKGRYTAYYHDSCCVGCCGMDDEDGEEVLEEDDDDEPAETMQFQWDVVRSLPLSPTAAEVPRYMDSAPIGGSVVRLWDHAAGGGLTAAAASPRRRGRAGVVVSAF